MDPQEGPKGEFPGWIDMNEYTTKASNVIIHDKIAPTNTACWFMGLKEVTKLDLSKFKTSNVTNMSGMFSNCGTLHALDLSTFDTGNVTDMNHMFNECNSLTDISFGAFNTESVLDMAYMFADCRGLSSLDLSDFDTSLVKDMSYMFFGCSSLNPNVGNLGITNWNVQNVDSFECMFMDALVNNSVVDISNWEISEGANLHAMFGGLRSVYVKDAEIKSRLESACGNVTTFIVKDS